MLRENIMPTIKIAPSILSADFTRLGDEVRQALDGGAEYIHVDVMDGVFVPNISIGVPVVKSLRRAFPGAFLDVHLMITRPVRYVDAFADAGASLLTFHVEADEPENIGAAIAAAKSRNLGVCLSVKPKTPAESLAPWLDLLDMILVMTVEPGFGGQHFMAEQMDKVRALRRLFDDRNLDIRLEVDGGVDRNTAPVCIEAGADVLVAGSAVFRASDRREAVRLIRGQ